MFAAFLRRPELQLMKESVNKATLAKFHGIGCLMDSAAAAFCLEAQIADFIDTKSCFSS